MKRVVALLAVFVAAGATSASALTPPVPLSVTISSTGTRAPDGFKFTVSGTATCSKNHRFAMTIDAIQLGSGGFAAGGFPSIPANLKGKARQKAVAASLCSGKPQQWSATVESRGVTPNKFIAGEAKVCVIARARLSVAPGSLTDLTSTCAQVRLS